MSDRVVVVLRDKRCLGWWTANDRETNGTRVREVPVVNPVRQMAKQWGCSRKEAERRLVPLLVNAARTE
jgi:hypothetical protein